MRKFLRPNLIIIFIVLLLSVSCEAFRDDPDYVGTWQLIEQINADDLVFNTNRIVILNRNSYEETYTIQRENSQTISTIIGMKGDLKTSHSTMIFELKELGTCDLDESEVCTGDVVWFGEGTPYWNDNITYFKKTVTGVYEVTGTSLHLTRDLNTDGDYEDTGEDIILDLI